MGKGWPQLGPPPQGSGQLRATKEAGRRWWTLRSPWLLFAVTAAPAEMSPGPPQAHAAWLTIPPVPSPAPALGPGIHFLLHTGRGCGATGNPAPWLRVRLSPDTGPRAPGYLGPSPHTVTSPRAPPWCRASSLAGPIAAAQSRLPEAGPGKDRARAPPQGPSTRSFCMSPRSSPGLPALGNLEQVPPCPGPGPPPLRRQCWHRVPPSSHSRVNPLPAEELSGPQGHFPV